MARRAATLAGAAALLALCVAAPALGPRAAAEGFTRPNIVLIVTDDQTVSDLYAPAGPGHRRALMHATLRLIRNKGVTFSRAYSSNPISCPSRTTLLTGQYSFNHKIFANSFPGGGYCADPGRLDLIRSLPVWLQAAGYRTLHYGRFLNTWGTGHPTLVAPGWSRWVTPVTTKASPAALYYGYHLNVNGVVSHMYGRVHQRDRAHYFTDVITTKAIKRIGANPTQPFFLELDHRAPHEDLVNPIGPEPAARYAHTLRGRRPPRPPSFNEADTSDKAPFLRHSRPLTGRELRTITKRNRRRLQSLQAVDDSDRRLLAALRRVGALQNTYVIFISDNGFFRGEHRFLKGKRRPYEPATRVPLLIRGPGIPAGRRSRELVSDVDIAPTILQLANAIPDRIQDGRPLLPFAVDPNLRSSRPILLESYFGHFGFGSYEPVGNISAFPEPTPRTWKAIVIGHWKLIRYGKGIYELYDLRRDPNELHSLARKPAFRPTRAYLAGALKRLAHCSGDTCRDGIAAPPDPRG